VLVLPSSASLVTLAGRGAFWAVDTGSAEIQQLAECARREESPLPRFCRAQRGKLFNSMLFIDNTGVVRAVYRKVTCG